MLAYTFNTLKMNPSLSQKSSPSPSSATKSRTWHQAFSPILWANLSFVNQYTVSLFRSSPQIQAAILRHAPHVRSIHSVFCYTFESLPVQVNLFQNLTRLDSLASELHNKGIVDHTNAVRLLQFIKVNTSLREIRLTVFPLANESVSELLGATLASHPGLVSATITCFTEAHLRGVRHVLRGAALGRLESLRLTCRGNHSSSAAFSTSSTASTSTATARTTIDQEQDEGMEALLPEGHVARHFKELRVDAELQHIYHLTILPLLRHCPNLESLLVTGLDMTRSMQMQGLCQVLEGTATRLRHLTLACSSSSSSTYDNNGHDEQHSARLLEACQTDRLQSLVVQSGLFIGRHSIRALLSFSRQHRFTLQELDFENCRGGSVESKDLQLILTSCPNLITFLAMAPPGRTAGSSNSSSTTGGNGGGGGGGGGGSRNSGADMRINIKDLPIGMGNRPAWVCLRLQRLSIGFSGFLSLNRSNLRTSLSNYLTSTDNNGVPVVTGVNIGESSGTSIKIYVDHIYSQLALLTELRTLHLGGEIEPVSGPGSATAAAYASAFPTGQSSFDLTMRSGLTRLETLSQLQELDVQRLWHHRISARECAWMARSFPCLRTFRGSTSAVLMDDSEAGAGSWGGGVKKPVFVREMKRLCPKVEVWVGSQRT
ncbi:hypothetical protein KI688_003006 [Linnemannia hyalina]|uniref:RNI-like protein n=1 Tax=Linnemannia hyalina TaxID=64524 RepID=A0A9P7XQC2_9FUNG|nr:hypothetical protein KI688_003006 [Linnemannia hyalina]